MLTRLVGLVLLSCSALIASQSPWDTSASPNSRTRAAERPVSGRSLSPLPSLVNQTCTAEAGVYINDVPNVVKTMRSFPPRANDTSEPLTVYVGVVLTKLEDLTPERSEFRAKVQVDMYWDAADCTKKASINWACLERPSTFYFMRARNTKNPDAQIINSDVRFAPAFAGEYPTQCLVGHFTDVSMILHKSFNPLNYPYEMYNLPIVFDAVASTNNIRLKLLNTASFYQFEDDLPSGWFSVDGFKCFEGETLQSLNFRGDGAPISFSYIKCGCALYSFGTVWWLGSFIFWLVSLGINFFSGVAVFGLSADSHELVTNLRNRGAVASGTVLAYVFVVPPEPRGIPTTTIATSSVVFTTGLTVLVISSLYSFLLSMIVKIVLQEKTHSSRWYDALLFNESMLRTIEMADEHVSATRMQVTVDSTLAGVSSGSEVNGNSTAKAAAPASAEARSISLSNARFWRRTGMLDTGIWASMHLTGLLISLVRLIGAANDFEASKSSFESATGL